MVARVWPIDTPENVKQLAAQHIELLEDYDGEVAGPAASLAFAYTILSLAGHGDDVSAVDRMTNDLCELIVRYGAAVRV